MATRAALAYLVLQPLRFTMPRCCQTSGGLLPRHFTLTAGTSPAAVSFLWHWLSVQAWASTAYPLGSRVRCVVQTFLGGNQGPRGSTVLQLGTKVPPIL